MKAAWLQATDDDLEDMVRVELNDKGHSGSGGPKSSLCLINITVFPGPNS
jgi:hypothetical protein